MKRINGSNKMKGFFTDSLWSIAGLVMMNVVAQFAVYPVWNRILGSEEYGNIVYLISMMNIVAVSMGTSCNYARMRDSARGKTNNRPYLYAMLAGSAALIPLMCIFQCIGIIAMSWMELALFYLLACVTMFRYYADVEYRLYLNYKGYFLYYLAVSAGYLIGIALFLWSGLWQLALLPGELAGLLLVFCKGTVFKKDSAMSREELRPLFHLIIILLWSNFLSNLIFNGDRLLLKILISGSAVTVYYLASLLGKTVSLITTPLNSVLIGYFSRYDGKFTVRMMNRVTLFSLTAAILATAACVVGSYILIPILYPQDYAAAKEYFVIANLSQVLYFIGNVTTNVILLRFAKERYQVYVNVTYAALFCLLCIPLALIWHIAGFCFGLLITCAVRLLLSLVLGYKDVERENTK